MKPKTQEEILRGTYLQETADVKREPNKEHKDQLFTEVFSTEEALLSLYNAVNNSNYTDPSKLKFDRLGNYLFLGMHNDVSFCIDCSLNLYEHQSTINENMPLRNLFYVSDILKVYVKENKLDIYGTKLIKLPNPQFVVFYNGERNLPDKTELFLKDAFESSVEKDCSLDLKVTIFNINYGHNKEMMSKCPLLEEYAIFVHTVRKYLVEYKAIEKDTKLVVKLAVRRAASECIEKGILKAILLRGGIIDMIDLYYDEELHRKSEAEYNQEIGEERGVTKGKIAGKIELIFDFLNDKGLVSQKLKEFIQAQTDFNVLNVWGRQAAYCASIDDFCKTIGFAG